MKRYYQCQNNFNTMREKVALTNKFSFGLLTKRCKWSCNDFCVCGVAFYLVQIQIFMKEANHTLNGIFVPLILNERVT